MATSISSTGIQYGWAGRIMSDVVSSTLRAAARLKSFQTILSNHLRFKSCRGFDDNIDIINSYSKWLGRQDSNLRMLGSKPSALPLGDGPISVFTC
jgi:hypothetical protein